MTLDESDHPKEECGIVGIYSTSGVAKKLIYGLLTLQHRGQESAGIAVSDGNKISVKKNTGLVTEVFTLHKRPRIDGNLGIGHTRYSTTGSPFLKNAQPFSRETSLGPIAIAHNGNLVNSFFLRRKLEEKASGLLTSSDSEIILESIIDATGQTWLEKIAFAMPSWTGAYSLLVLTSDSLIAIRDPWGFRPLSFGVLADSSYMVASETCTLQTLGFQNISDVKPGEVIEISSKGLKSLQVLVSSTPTALCVFEHIYFSRPDSFWDGISVHAARYNLGKELASEHPTNADLVIPIPDTSIPIALGYSDQSKISYTEGIILNRYIGRTFIDPYESRRDQGVNLKYSVIKESVKNRRIVLVDDTIVRGHTTKFLVQLLRANGAKEVHLRISSPPLTHPCFMGVDIGTYGELIAHNRRLREIQELVGADSLQYLSLDGMMLALNRKDGYCQACFTGKYPIPIDQVTTKTGFEK